eukprot:GSA25T00015837001.1
MSSAHLMNVAEAVAARHATALGQPYDNPLEETAVTEVPALLPLTLETSAMAATLLAEFETEFATLRKKFDLRKEEVGGGGDCAMNRNSVSDRVDQEPFPVAETQFKNIVELQQPAMETTSGRDVPSGRHFQDASCCS